MEKLDCVKRAHIALYRNLEDIRKVYMLYKVLFCYFSGGYHPEVFPVKLD